MFFNIGPARVSRLLNEIGCPVQIASCIVKCVIAFRTDLVLVRHHAEKQSSFAGSHRAAIFGHIIAARRLELLSSGPKAILRLLRDGGLCLNAAGNQNR